MLRVWLTAAFAPDVAAGFPAMFFFFSNRLGCLGSLLLSAVVTVALLFLFGMLRF
jgi:hypothetical protein